MKRKGTRQRRRKGKRTRMIQGRGEGGGSGGAKEVEKGRDRKQGNVGERGRCLGKKGGRGKGRKGRRLECDRKKRKMREGNGKEEGN